MITIHKQTEPKELTEYRAKPDAVYDEANFTDVKDKIRAQLLTEQGYLCAYCMERIRADKMKIEHWHPQKSYPHEQLSYANLLGVCQGNEGKKLDKQHCDTRKGNQLIDYTPANLTIHIEDKLRYFGDGFLKATEANFNRQINDILNLNWVRLKKNRQSVFDAIIQVLGHKDGSRTLPELQKYLAVWQQTDHKGQLPPYAGVAIYLLKKKLRKHPKSP